MLDGHFAYATQIPNVYLSEITQCNDAISQ